jgi:hypothetical protein
MKGIGFYPTHSDLWTCCKQMATQAIQMKRGAYYFDIAQMLFAFLSYEAYLNFIISFVAPQEWSNERLFFSSKPYQGIKGKLKFIEGKLDLKIKRDVDPYKTVASLEEFRDFITHGKPYHNKLTLKAVKKSPNFPFNGKLYQWVTPDRAANAMTQVFALCQVIHQKALSNPKLVSFWQLGKGPFDAVESVEMIG